MRSSLFLFLVLVLGNSCLERISFDVGELNQGVLIVEGAITDQPGPYTVRLFRSANVDDNLLSQNPYVVKQVTLSDDAGNSEVLVNRKSGLYETLPDGIRGVVGRKYSLQIELLDGTIFKSTPDEMKPAGEIDTVYYTFEAHSPLNAPTEYGFRIFANASIEKEPDTYLRWRYTGTYRFLTYPELHKVAECSGGPDPYPCSGKIVRNGLLTFVFPCECCQCYVSDYETQPHLNDKEVLTDGTFKKVALGFVPFNEITFSQHKYMIKVEQMSLSRVAYEFWKVIRDQKEGLASLFQPAFGKIPTNFYSKSATSEVIGIFYASAVKQKVLFITGKDAPVSEPVPVIPPGGACAFWNPCDQVLKNASRTPPPEWH